jgi:hypothetical protein
LQESSPQKCHGTGVDGLPRESEPEGFPQVYPSFNSITLLTVAQALSFDEEVEAASQILLDALALLDSKLPHMDPAWFAEFCEAGEPLFNFVKEHNRNETRRTLPKTK